MSKDAIIDLIMRVLRALDLIKPDTPTPPLPEDPAPEPPQSTDRILFPTGMIQTRMPNGAASIPWSQIARWEPLFTKAVTEGGYTYHPLLLALFAVVESRGNQYTTGQMTGTRDQVVPGMGDPRSKGLLQIRLDLHQANAPQWDGMTPEGNIRLGALLLDRWMKDEGSWEAALSHKWHPGTDPFSQVTQQEYVRFVREAIAEVKTAWPKPEDPKPEDPAPGEITFGKVPLPAFRDRRIPDANNKAWNALGKRSVKGVVYHRQQGSNWGTDEYFRKVPPGGVGTCPPPGPPFVYGGCNGLTDWGVDSDGGETLMWNSPNGYSAPGVSAHRSPWASGPWREPPGDGALFVGKYGVDAINRDLASIEIDDFFDDPVDDDALEQVAALTAYHADQAQVPWDQFPHNPHTGLVLTYWHNEFCGQDYKACPGKVVMDATPEIIKRAKAIMKQHQVAA